MLAGVRPANLFPQAPVIHFYPESERCPVCGGPVQVLKTRRKRLVTLQIGPIIARETILVCPRDQTVLRCGQLRRLSPLGGKFGFDVLVHVGLELFMRHRGVKPIVEDLRERNIRISEREVGCLGRKFIIYLSLAHRDSQGRLRAAMQRRGGYILHLDGTCDGDSPILFVGLDELSEIVLESVKIPSEHTATLVPFLTEIRERYGVPLALVHDMGRGILAAVSTAFPGVPDYICHFHFLRDIGKDLLEREYNLLRKRLRQLRVRAGLYRKLKSATRKSDGNDRKLDSLLVARPGLAADRRASAELTRALIHWILDYPSQLHGYGFPFDRPHLAFHQRLEAALHLLHRLPQPIRRRPLRDLRALLEAVTGDPELKAATHGLAEKAKVFDQLREALSIALPEGGKGLNDDGADLPIQTIQTKVKAFRQAITDTPALIADRPYLRMILQIDKYWAKLFADPLLVQTPDGPVRIQPQRTNNIMERFFRSLKRGQRLREGIGSLAKTLQSTLKETPLVKNLSNPEYMSLLLDQCTTLEQRFAEIDSRRALQALRESEQNTNRVSPGMKKLIRRPDFQQKLSEVFATYAN